jgi:serine/threonine protein kinase
MLRRIENYSLVNESLIAAFEVHSRISNPYIVQLKEVFTTKHFHDDSVVFVYEYEANFVPLGQLPWKQLFFREDDIWFLVCQLVSALKSVHEKGLPFRGLNFDNILYSGDRVKLDYFGMFDLINPLQSSLLVAFQDDLMSFGKLMLDMISANHPKFKITDHSTTNYSSDFLNLVRYLLSPPSPSKTIDDLIFKLGHRLLVAMNRCAR